MQESSDRRRREEDSELRGKWFTVLYLYQSVCQSSTLLQCSEEEHEDEKRDVEKVESERQWEITEEKPPQTQEDIIRK